MIIPMVHGRLPIFQSHHLRLSMQRSIRISYFSLAILRSCLACCVTAANLPQPYIRKGGDNISQVAHVWTTIPQKITLHTTVFRSALLPANQ